MTIIKQMQLMFVASCLAFLSGCYGDSPPGGTIGFSSGNSEPVPGVEIITSNELEGTSWETDCFEDQAFDPDGVRTDLVHLDDYNVKYKLRINNDADRVTLTHRYWDISNTTCDGDEDVSYEARYEILSVTNVLNSTGVIIYHRFNLELTQATGWTDEKYVDFDTGTIDDEKVLYFGDCYDLDGNTTSGTFVDCGVFRDRPLFETNVSIF